MRRIFIKRKNDDLPEAPPSVDNFPSYTKKEIFTQGELIEAFTEKYVSAGRINFDYLKIKIDKIKRVYVVGSDADYACAVFGAYNLEVLFDVISVPLPASEFLHSNPILDKSTMVVLIEGRDYEKALKRAEKSKAKIISIMSFSSRKDAITFDYKSLGEFETAEFSLKLVALSLLALYLGEKSQVVTELYVKIALQMLSKIKEKIKGVLSQEFYIKELSSKLNFENMIVTGTNVDYAVAIYAGKIFSHFKKCNVLALPYGELSVIQKESSNLLSLASNMEFCNLFDMDGYQLKIAPNSANDGDLNAIFYDESIPLLNPILISVAVQLIAYKNS